MNERALFDAALEISDAAARKAFLDQSCAGQPQLRARLDVLLASHDAAGDFLAAPPLPPLTAKTTAIEGAATGDAEAEKTLGYADAASPGDKDVSLGFLAHSTKPGSLGRLGHYEVEEILGQGAFGIVLKAFDEKLHRRVAIKVMSPELAATSPPRKRFRREAQAAANIRHENVVAVHAVEDSPLPYLVMEYIPGITLERALQDHGPLDADDVLRLGQQIASGLAAAHAQGLIHRDIKPSNILLENGLMGRVKITDFGLARAADDASLTQSGIIAGTPMYMSPEQAQSGQIDQRSDLFSLGSVLYVMISGRPPFRASTTLAVLKRVVEDTPRPIREIIADTPDWLCAIIAKLQAKQPEDRFATAREVADLLGKCLADLQANRPVELPADVWPAEETSVTITPSKPAVGDSGIPATPSPGFAHPRTPALPHAHTSSRRAWPTVAAAALILLAGLGITEATGVTKLASTVIRLTTGSGTLVIETDDPSVKVTIDGEEVSIQGAGVEQLTLKPGQYKIAAVKDGEPVSQQLVTITRGGKQVVRVSLEGIASVNQSPSDSQPSTLNPQHNADPDRRGAEWVLANGGTIKIREDGESREIKAGGELPAQAFQLESVDVGGNPVLTDEGLAYFKGCKNLTALVLHGGAISDKGLANFQDCNDLEQLALRHMAVTDAGLAHFADCHNLRLLDLVRTGVTDAGLAKFRNCKQLRILALEGSRGWTTAGLASFRDCLELEELLLGHTIADDSALAHLQMCRNLKVLDLTNTQVTDLSVAKYRDCSNLQAVQLRYTQITDAALEYLRGCRGLVVLLLDGTRVTDAGLPHVQNWPKLESLTLGRTCVSDAGLVDLLKFAGRGLNVFETRISLAGSQQLKNARPDFQLGWSETNRLVAESVLALGGKVEIGTPEEAEPRPVADVAEFPHEFFQVRRISLAGVEKLPDDLLGRISWLRFSQFDQLERVDLWEISGLNYEFLTTVHGLRELNLTKSKLTDVSLAQLPKLLALERLVLDDNDLKGPGLASLKQQPALRELSLKKINVSAAIVQKLAAALPRCRIEWDGGVIKPTLSDDPDRRAAEWVLSAGGTINIVSDGREQRVKSLDDLPDTPIILAGIHLEGRPDVTNEDLTRFRDSKNLTHVHLGAMPLGDAGLENFRNCTDLKNLYLSGTNVTDAGLAHFRDCRLLESLMLRSTRITDAGLAHFQDCEHLAALYLGNTAVSDAGLELLGPQQHLVDLDLSGTRISDEGLLRFQQGTALKVVFLDGTGITNAVLELLEGMPHLVGVQVRKTDVTAAGVQKLAAALPRCRIEWDGGEIEPQADVNQPIELELPHLKGKPFPTSTAATWKPGPKENVLPGLIPRPAKLDGVARWQIETIAPRGKVGPIAMSPDHKYVACVLEALSTLSLPCTVRLYDAETGDLAGLFPNPSGVGSISWHPDSRQFATGGVDGQVRVWTTEGQRGAEWPAHKDRVHVAWGPNGKWLATRTESEDREAKLWDVDGKSIADLAGPALKITVLAWSPDSQWLAVGDDKGKVQLWKPDGTKGPGYQTDMRSIDSIAWRPDGQQFAFGGFQDLYAEFTHLYLAGTGGEPPQMINIKRRLITLLSWSPDGQIIGASYFDSFGLWNVEGTPVRQLEDTEGIAETGGRFPVTSLTWNPDGQHVITNRGQVWGADGTLKNTIWDNGAFAGWTRDGQKLVGVSPNHGVVKCGLDGTTSVDNKGEPWLQPGPIASWHARSPAFVAGPSNGFRWWTLDGRPAPVMASGADFSPIAPGVPGVLCSPGGHRILTAYGNFVALRDRHKLIRYQNFPVGILTERSSWSPDGKRMALGSNEGAVIVTFDSPEIVTLGEMPREVVDVAWSPDGQWIATAEDNFVRLWKPDGTPGNVLEFPSKIMVVRWHPNSRELAVEPMYGHTNFEVREIDGTPKLNLRSPLMHGLLRSSWSRDGKLLVAGNHWEQFPGTHLAAWNMDDCEVAWHAPLKPHHARQLRKLEWSADDQHLLTQSDDGIFGVWSVRGELQWLIACPNDRDSFSFDAAGQLLHGDPAQLDGWFRCFIEGEDGTFATLKPSEFAQRFAEFVMPGSWPEEGKPTDPERKAATRLLEIGCELGVYVGGVGRTVKKVDELPRERFSIWVIKGPLTDADLVWLHKNRQTFEELFSLYLSGGSNTDQGLKLLRDFSSLWHLEAGHAEKIGPGLEIPQVTCLSGTFPKATAATIQHLKVISDLLELELRGPKVTEAMIDELTQLHTVRRLDLRRAQVSPDGIERLKAALPLCNVLGP